MDVLSEISDLLDAWGGHRYAAGFSVLTQNWNEVEEELERLLAGMGIREEPVAAINISPACFSLIDWRAVK